MYNYSRNYSNNSGHKCYPNILCNYRWFIHACVILIEVVGPIIYMGLKQGMVIIGSRINVLGTMVNIPCAWVKWKGSMTRWKHVTMVHFVHYFGGIFSFIWSNILSSKYKIKFWYKTSNIIFVTFHMMMFFQQTFIYSHIYACFHKNPHLNFSHEIKWVKFFI